MTKAEVRTSVRNSRVRVSEVTPKVYRAMVALGEAAGEGLEPVIAELVGLRCAQLNGCAFCMDLHTTNARAAGVSEERLLAVRTWRAAPLFTQRERAALALAEAVTFVADDHVPDDVYDAASRYFGESELAHLLWSLAAANAWNRMGVSTRLMPASTAKGPPTLVPLDRA